MKPAAHPLRHLLFPPFHPDPFQTNSWASVGSTKAVVEVGQIFQSWGKVIQHTQGSSKLLCPAHLIIGILDSVEDTRNVMGCCICSIFTKGDNSVLSCILQRSHNLHSSKIAQPPTATFNMTIPCTAFHCRQTCGVWCGVREVDWSRVSGAGNTFSCWAVYGVSQIRYAYI